MSDALNDEITELLREALDADPDTIRTVRIAAQGVVAAPVELGASVSERHAERYEMLGLLGRGGMAEVYRVRDRHLQRTMAMKILYSDLAKYKTIVARFIEEAQCSAQLQHPGVVPVHELGTLPDGRAYFTMAEVRGRTFAEAIVDVHQAIEGSRWGISPSGWSFRRLIDALHRVCETVAYAHQRGVVHRDLKPENILVGEHGEVLVVDWGLAKVKPGFDAGPADFEPVLTDRSLERVHATRMGEVAGTPAYMPPEQARGEVSKIDARSDVYALGAILYEVLSGRAPFTAATASEVLVEVLAGPPVAVDQPVSTDEATFDFGLHPDRSAFDGPPAPPLPAELVRTCERAMSRDRSSRFVDGAAIAREIGDWLDGARRREKALVVVEKAKQLRPRAAALRARANGLRVESARQLAMMDTWAGEEVKSPSWALEDRASEMESEAIGLELQFVHTLHGALTHAPTMPEVHAALVRRYRAEHAESESRRDLSAVQRAEARLRVHAAVLPEGDTDREATAQYLKGAGTLTLTSTPPGAEVLLYRYETKHRRLVPVFQRSLGPTPLNRVPIEMGSYLCVLRHPGMLDLSYPIQIDRLRHWDGVPPGGKETQAVPMSHRDTIPAGECEIAAGWFWSGGDEGCASLPRRRLWVDRLVVKKFPVTNLEYLVFLDDLVAQGMEKEALEHVPRQKASNPTSFGSMLYGRRDDGSFFLRPDEEGHVWLPGWPVCNVNWHGADAYASWLAARTGKPWRMIGELEWEKAARGVDGRFLPWGWHPDPSWSCHSTSHAEDRVPSVVDAYPVDESVYGVRGMAGNMRGWCAEAYTIGGPVCPEERVCMPVPATSQTSAISRGGSWGGHAKHGRAADRVLVDRHVRESVVGFRVCRSV